MDLNATSIHSLQDTCCLVKDCAVVTRIGHTAAGQVVVPLCQNDHMRLHLVAPSSQTTGFFLEVCLQIGDILLHTNYKLYTHASNISTEAEYHKAV